MAQQSPTVVDLAEIGRVQPKVYEAILKKARNERGYLPGKAGETLEILGKDPATYGQFGDHEDEKARQFTKALNKYSLDLALIVAAGGNRLSSDTHTRRVAIKIWRRLRNGYLIQNVKCWMR